MALPTLTWLEDYAAFTASSINNLLEGMQTAVNGITPEMLLVPAYNENHFATISIAAGRLKTEDPISTDHSYTQNYGMFGENGNRVVITGSVVWQILFPAITLGTANIDALLVLANAHYIRTVENVMPPTARPMICLQYVTGGVWTTMNWTERIQTVRRSVDTTDILVNQDMMIATLLTAADIAVPFTGLRIVTAITNNAAGNIIYFREGSIAMIPLFAEVVP